MRCPRCGTENREGAQFCRECGARLDQRCPACGASVGSGSKFCDACGSILSAAPAAVQARVPSHLAQKILLEAAALEGERKQVTVFFADLRGSMELLADRDPEDARALLDPVLERMIEAVHHYEGTVNQVMGDGIMALFGAPLAHEDHAVRACYAALRMQDSIRRYADEVRRTHAVALHIRAGLNSGDVVVRSIGSDLHMDYTAVGQTTHLAARMEQAAMPGSILITAQTLRLAEGFVDVRPVGPIQVKGLSEPVEVHELTGARAVGSRFLAAVTRGLTRFVGRETELQHIRQALGRAAAGHGQVVAVAGEPGLGKSRLAWEVTHSPHTQGWLALVCDSVSYGRGIPYLPVIDLLKAYFKIGDRDGQREIREKVTGKLLILDRALEPDLPVFLSLLNVPVDDPPWAALDPPQRRRRTLDTAKRLLLRESLVQPLLLLFENLHWIDSETQAVLDTLVESLPAARVLLLVNYRPEYQHGWGSKTYYMQLRLDPLPLETAEQFLQALLGDDAALQPLKRLLIDRTEGNPFFLEESVRALVETGVLTGERSAYRLARPLSELLVPATVQALLAARLDRLSSPDKRLLQAASVMGKDIPFTVLRAVAGLPDLELREGLARLQAAEFLYEASIFPDLEYTFKHALTQEVAYGSLLHEQRREWHRQVGEAVEQLFVDRKEESYGTLARHFVECGDLPRGLQYSLLAAEQASRLFAHDEAVRHYSHARACAEAQRRSDHLVLIDEAVGDVNFMRGQFERAVACYEQAAALAATHEKRADLKFKIGRVYGGFADPRGVPFLMAAAEELDAETQGNELAQTLAFIGRYHHYAGRHATAVEWLERARRLAEPLGQPEPLSAIYGHLAGAYMHMGRFEESFGWARQCIEVGERGDHPLGVARGYTFLGQDMWMLGRWEESLAFTARAYELAKQIGAEHRMAWAHSDKAAALSGKGDLAEALASARAGLALAEATGERRLSIIVLGYMSRIETDLDEAESAQTHALAAFEMAEALGERVSQVLTRDMRAYVHMQREEWEQAAELFDQWAALLTESDNRFTRLYGGHHAAEVAARAGRSEEALSMIDAALELAREVGSRHYEGVARRVHGQILASLRRWEEATQAFDNAVAMLEANGSRLELGRALFHRGLMHQARAEADAARLDLTRAHAILASTGARRDRDRVERALAAAASSDDQRSHPAR